MKQLLDTVDFANCLDLFEINANYIIWYVGHIMHIT
jgi:hypothetical protein